VPWTDPVKQLSSKMIAVFSLLLMPETDLTLMKPSNELDGLMDIYLLCHFRWRCYFDVFGLLCERVTYPVFSPYHLFL